MVKLQRCVCSHNIFIWSTCIYVVPESGRHLLVGYGNLNGVRSTVKIKCMLKSFLLRKELVLKATNKGREKGQMQD